MISPDPDKPTPRRRGWQILIVVAGIYVAAMAVAVGIRTGEVTGDTSFAEAQKLITSDFRDFWYTARHFRETGEVSTDFGVHNYLPFFTIFMMPWSLLPFSVAAVLFSVLSLVLMGIAVALAENLLGLGLGSRPRGACLIAIVLSLAYVHACAVLGNVGLLLAFLVIMAWFLVEREREWEAGLALGLAVLIKLLPALLIVFFLFKRRWRVVGSSVAVLAVLGFGMTGMTIGWKETFRQHAEFYRRAVQGHSAINTLTSDKPEKIFYNNNSVPAVLRRLFSPIDGGKSADRPMPVTVINLPGGGRVAIYIILMLALFGGTIAVTLRGPPHWPPDTLSQGIALRAQFALWCCLMLLASPLVWTHYLVLAYLPLAFLVDRLWRSRRDPGVFRLCAAGLVLWLVCTAMLAWPAARAAGAQIAGVLCLWLAILPLAIERQEPPTPRVLRDQPDADADDGSSPPAR